MVDNGLPNAVSGLNITSFTSIPWGVARAAGRALTGRPFACRLQAYDKPTTEAPSRASRPQGRRVPASEKSAYRVSAGVRSDPGLLRRVTAIVEVEGVEREMTFVTNNTVWSARTIAELYRARWTIELFFNDAKT